MLTLTSGAVYQLPDGRRYYAIAVGSDKFFLYPDSSGPGLPPAYQVLPDGAICLAETGEVRYRLEDLTAVADEIGGGD